jgi:hypothetical protein
MPKYKANRFYFTEETEKSIIKYQTMESGPLKNKLFSNDIFFPFRKIAENLIHRYKFYSFNIPLKDVEIDVCAHLESKIPNFDQTKGKAFSFFSVIALYWLMSHNNNNIKYQNSQINIEGFSESESNRRMNELLIQSQKTISTEERSEIQDTIFTYADFIENEMSFLFTKKRDINIAHGIINILRRYDNITTFNKKALYVLIREYSNEDTNYITKVLQKLKKYKHQIIENNHKTNIRLHDLIGINDIKKVNIPQIKEKEIVKIKK